MYKVRWFSWLSVVNFELQGAVSAAMRNHRELSTGFTPPFRHLEEDLEEALPDEDDEGDDYDRDEELVDPCSMVISVNFMQMSIHVPDVFKAQLYN